MNKTIPALTLICGFLLGVIAGPWLWPRDLLTQAPLVPTPSPQAVILPEALPASPATEATAPILATAPAQEEPDLILKGVLVGEDAARSRALIAHGIAEPRLYKVDDKLPDGSVLKTVDNKRVEIEKNGNTTHLTLDRGKPSTRDGADTPAADSADAPAVPEPAVAEPASPAPVTASSEAATPEE
jgi:hypothetical protein